MRRLRMATAAAGALAVVGTGGITLAVAQEPLGPSEADTGTSTDTPAPGTPAEDAGLSAPAQAPQPADSGPADAVSGGS